MKKLATIAITLLALVALISCTAMTCKRRSINEARQWESRGYQARIVVYQTSPLVAHAQAQVLTTGNTWRYAARGELSDLPEYEYYGRSIIQYWPVEAYYKMLVETGYYK